MAFPTHIVRELQNGLTSSEWHAVEILELLNIENVSVVVLYFSIQISYHTSYKHVRGNPHLLRSISIRLTVQYLSCKLLLQ